jgi:hypothetical protein
MEAPTGPDDVRPCVCVSAELKTAFSMVINAKTTDQYMARLYRS